MAGEKTSTGDLGLDLLRAVTRLEGKVDGVDGKIDTQNLRLDRLDQRSEILDRRLNEVERRQENAGSFKAGVEAGQNHVMTYVKFGWTTLGAAAGLAVAFFGPIAKAWLFR